jgi:hypothetical protein
LLCEKIEQEQPVENEAARATLSSQPPQVDMPPVASGGPPSPRMPALDLSSELAGGDGASTGFSIEA